MGHVTLTTPTWGQLVIRRQKANWSTKFEASSLAVAVAEKFQGVYNSKMCHVTLTTPLSRMT